MSLAMTIPKSAGVSHISFSARDAEACATWWHDVMGFEEYDRVSGEDWFGIVLLHAPTSTLVEFQQHASNNAEPFDSMRTGFDHMGFRVTDPSQLSEWEETFGDWRSTALRQFMLHNWGRDAKQALLQRTYDALPEGGALIVYDMAIDDERPRQPGWPPDEPEHADHGPGGVRLHRCGLSKLAGGRGLPRHLRGAPCRALFKGGGLQVNLTASSPTPRLRHDAYMPPAVRLRGEGECGWTSQEMLR
jgi:glyoxylase I family protein